MKLSELNSLNGDVSRAASTQARTLALAGLGVIWLFAGPFFLGTAGAAKPSDLLFVAGGLLVSSLALDLVQLFARAGLLNAAFARQQRRLQPALKEGLDPETGSLGAMIQRVMVVLFYAKAIPLLVGYGLVLAFFFTSL